MPSVAVTPATGNLLIAYSVKPIGTSNHAPIAHSIEAFTGATFYLYSQRTGTAGLISLESGNSYRWLGAYKSAASGLWSEVSDVVNFTPPLYTGSSTEGSIGSGATKDVDLQSSNIAFPDLSVGTGKMETRRVLVSTGDYRSEVRQETHRKGRTVIHVTLKMLDANQAKLIHRFFNALNGPLTPFFFDFTPPENGSQTTGGAVRYLMRFRDPSVVTNMFDTTVSDASFYLVDASPDAEEDA